MFSPTIVFHASDSLWKIILDPLQKHMPYEGDFPIDDSKFRRININPNIMRTDEPPNFTKISQAPTTFVYCFSCSSKSEYSDKILPKFKNYISKFNRKYNTILPVYINKMKHSKGIFSTNASTESSIRIDYPELVMIPVDKHGNVSSYNMNHLWGCIMKMTMQTMVTRILILNISITNSKNVDFSVKTFRHYLRLVAIYNSLTFYDLQEEETEKALSLIDQNPSLFTDFFYDWELNKAINVFQFSEYYETYIMKGIPSEFGLRYMFGMWQIKSCSQTHDIINYIHYAYDLYKKLVNKINKKNPKEYVWILQFLHDISIICSKENNKHIEFTHVLNDYITELNLLIKLNENDRIYDFSSIENSENFEIIVTINDVHQIIQEKNNMLRCIGCPEA